MVMIARDERENVRPCFDSFWGHVDEVVLCDTGSGDGTVAEAERYAAERGELEKLIIGHFAWCDDFAAARNAAHELATGDVHATVDLDDRLEGAEHLPTIMGQFLERSELGSIYAMYVGSGALSVARLRLIRAPVRWIGRTWEEPAIVGEQQLTSLVRWRHAGNGRHGRRDLDIALGWADEDPHDWRPWAAAACEAAYQLHDWELVGDYADRALSLGRAVMPAQTCAVMLELQAVAASSFGETIVADELAREAVDHWPQFRSCVLIS
jgi:glycosyltransferase involved in cell wall biosynthesis